MNAEPTPGLRVTVRWEVSLVPRARSHVTNRGRHAGTAVVRPDPADVAGFTLHRSPGSSLWAPVLRPAALSLLAVLMFMSTQVPFLQSWLNTTPLTGDQWLVCAGLALVFGAIIEIDKARQRHYERKMG